MERDMDGENQQMYGCEDGVDEEDNFNENNVNVTEILNVNGNRNRNKNDESSYLMMGDQRQGMSLRASY